MKESLLGLCIVFVVVVIFQVALLPLCAELEIVSYVDAMNDKDLDAASEYANNIMEFDPLNTRYHDLTTGFRTIQKDQKGALEYARRAIEDFNGDLLLWPMHYNTAMILRGVSIEDITIDVMKESVRYNPYFWQAQFELGCMLLMKKNLPEAMKAFTKVLFVKPDHYESLNNVGMLFLNTDQPEKALGYLLKARRLVPESGKVIRMLGWLDANIRRCRLMIAKNEPNN